MPLPRPFPAFALLAVCLTAGFNLPAAVVQYDGFASTAGLTLNGNATTLTTSDGTVLRLTQDSPFQSGSTFSSVTVNAAAFSTFFQFRMTEPGGISTQGADGLVFVVQSISSSIGGAGGGIGYEGIGSSVGVEFDNYQNGWDPNNNHAAVVRNGNVQNHLQLTTLSPQMTDGDLWSVWIDYDGMNLQVRANTTGNRPAGALLSYAIDIPSVIGQANAYVGFTSGTGSAYANHDIVRWRYEDQFNPGGGDPPPVPEPSTYALCGIGMAAVFLARRWRGLNTNHG